MILFGLVLLARRVWFPLSHHWYAPQSGCLRPHWSSTVSGTSVINAPSLYLSGATARPSLTMAASLSVRCLKD